MIIFKASIFLTFSKLTSSQETVFLSGSGVQSFALKYSDASDAELDLKF